MFKLLIISSFFSITDTLPIRDSLLFASLRKFHTEQLETNLSEFEIKAPHSKKFEEVLKWMPQVGLGYNLLTDRVRPTISYNFNQIYSNLKEKKKLEIDEGLRLAKIQKILRGSQIAFKADSFTLVSLLSRMQIIHRQLAKIEANQTIQDELFTEQEKRYKDGLILPVNWIQIRLERSKQNEPYYAKLEQLDLLIIEIFRVAKF